MDAELSKKVQFAYERLNNLIWRISWDYKNLERWQLNPKEIYGDLCSELVRVCTIYSDKEGDELVRIVKVCLDHRISDILTQAYCTHRKVEDSIIRYDSLSDWEMSNLDMCSEDPNLDFGYSLELMTKSLSTDGQQLLNEALHPSTKTFKFLELAAVRRQEVFEKGLWTLTLTANILQRSLGWNDSRMKKAWNEVQTALQAI